MKNVLFALFPDTGAVQNVMQDLHSIGIPDDAMSIIQRKEDVEHTLTENKAPKVKETVVQGAEAGAVGGATAGVIGGFILGAAGPLGFLPGLLAAAATGVGGSLVGGLTGSLVGALVGAGFPEGVAKSYEKGIREGKVLLGTAVDGREEEKVKNIYTVYNGQEIQKIMVKND